MTSNKLLNLGRLENKVSALKKRGKKIVFTNGCFDILHPGHVRYLEKAAKLGNILIVAVNSDSSVRAIKGSGRPVFGQRQRALLVAALGAVDFVVIFNEPTPLGLIKRIKPDILVKGADWRKKDIVGKDTVNSYGGKVSRIPLVKGFSTSAIIAKIKGES